jgi:hypothetical protein
MLWEARLGVLLDVANPPRYGPHLNQCPDRIREGSLRHHRQGDLVLISGDCAVDLLAARRHSRPSQAPRPTAPPPTLSRMETLVSTPAPRRGLVRRGLIGVAVIIGLTALTPLTTASATSSPPPAGCTLMKDGKTLTPNCFAMNASPPSVVVPAGAYKTGFTQVFHVTNNGNTDYPMTIQAVDFTQSESGSLDLGTTTGLVGEAANWATVTPSTVLMKGSADTDPKATGVSDAAITVTVHPSTNASAGDHSIAIVFRDAAPAGGGIREVYEIGAQMLVQIPGPVIHGITVSHLTATATSRLFGQNLPGSVSLSLTVTNTGTVHQDFYNSAEISATVTGFGAPKRSVIALPAFTVLRGATRRVTTAPKSPLYCFCKLTVTANITSAADLTSTVTNPHVTWTPIKAARDYLVLRNGTAVSSTLSKNATSFTDPKPVDGGVYTVQAITATATDTISYTIIPVWQIIGTILALTLLVLAALMRHRRRPGRVLRATTERDAVRAQIRQEELDRIAEETGV